MYIIVCYSSVGLFSLFEEREEPPLPKQRTRKNRRRNPSAVDEFPFYQTTNFFLCRLIPTIARFATEISRDFCPFLRDTVKKPSFKNKNNDGRILYPPIAGFCC
jgi:hypothetical protein